MKLGDFIINIATKGDTKALDDSIKKLTQAEKKSSSLISYLKKLKSATNEHEKALIKKNFAQKVELDNLTKAKSAQDAFNNSMKSGLMSAMKWVGGITATVVALDRMGNSLLKANQMYMTFEQQTGLSIGRLNTMSGLARMSGMNMSPEQVASDITGLQQRIYRLGLTGEGAGIFAQLGMNPMGMDSDQFIAALRQRTKGMSAGSKSYILSELGISQEWLNVLNLSNEEFSDFIKKSKQLQLTEDERKQLAQYTRQQQVNNMRWEVARQRIILKLMPTIQRIMDLASKIAEAFANAADDKILQVFKGIALLMGVMVLKSAEFARNMMIAASALASGAIVGGGGAVKKVGGGILGMFAAKGIGKKIAGVAGKAGAKFLGRQAIAGAAAAAGGGVGSAPLAALTELALVGWGLFDVGKGIWDILHEEQQEEDREQDPISPVENMAAGNYYRALNSNMTNNFYNNPQPAKSVMDELTNAQDLLLKSAYI